MGHLPCRAAFAGRAAAGEREWWESHYRRECAALQVDAAGDTEGLFKRGLSPRLAALATRGEQDQ